jgi:hypothetical protein
MKIRYIAPDGRKRLAGGRKPPGWAQQENVSAERASLNEWQCYGWEVYYIETMRIAPIAAHFYFADLTGGSRHQLISNVPSRLMPSALHLSFRNLQPLTLRFLK